MSQQYLIKNQHDHYLSKQLAWVDGSEPATLFMTPHRDVALNQLIELNAKDIDLRGEVVPCELDAKGRPRLPQPA